jgi:hypothetical protein
VRIVDARLVRSADKRGSSWPVLVETEGGLQFTKLRGAAQGTGALVAEVIVAELAESLGLRVPGRVLVRFARDVESLDQNDELADLLRASAGINLGFAYLDAARNFDPSRDVPNVTADDAAAILWLDGLTANPDRTARNPNLLWWHDELWLIDHGAALGFQYSLPNVDASAPRRPYALREPHLLHSRVADLDPMNDARFAAAVSHAAVERAVAEVPDDFLLPLFGEHVSSAVLVERRQAYVDYLCRRLESPRPFLVPAAAPNDQQRKGRPAWAVNRGRGTGHG